MQGGGKREEAGPSSASGVVKDYPKGQLEINDKAENLAVVSSDDEEEQHQNHDEGDDADGGKIANFVPGPLISLKDQIEKDQVSGFIFPFFFHEFYCRLVFVTIL